MARVHSIRDYPTQAVALGGVAMLTGALAAVLFTPRRGSEVRYLMKHRGIAIKDRLRFAKSEIVETTERSATAATQVAKVGAGRARSTAQKLKDDAAKQTSRDAAKAGRRTKNDAQDMTDHIRRNGEP